MALHGKAFATEHTTLLCLLPLRPTSSSVHVLKIIHRPQLSLAVSLPWMFAQLTSYAPDTYRQECKDSQVQGSLSVVSRLVDPLPTRQQEECEQIRGGCVP